MRAASFVLAALVVLASAAAELRWHAPVADFALAALLAFAGLFSFGELVALVFVGVLALSWAPAMSPELAWFAALPLAAGFVRRIASFRPWAAHVAVLGGGLLLFYLGNDPGFIARNPLLFGTLWLSGVLYGTTVRLVFGKAFFSREQSLPA